MNPGTVLGQSIAAGVFLTTLAVLGQSRLALCIAVVGLLWALWLNGLYASKLGAQGRTARRAIGDRAIGRQLVLSYVGPVVIAGVLAYTGWGAETGVGPFTGGEVQGVVGVVAVMLVAWLVSSHADWYYIRPLIDGVVEAPPCRRSRETRWKGVTRKWYIHRTIASLFTMGAVVGIALIVTEVLNREWPSVLNEVGGFAAIVGVGLWLMRDEIRSAGPTSRSIRNPRHWVGDDLEYDTHFWKKRGFVLHVAIPVTKLVPLDRDTGARDPNTSFVEESSTLLDLALCRSQRFSGCDGGCAKYNRECTHEEPRTGVGGGRRLLF